MDLAIHTNTTNHPASKAKEIIAMYRTYDNKCITSMNDAADVCFYDIGINIIPTNNKIPIEKYERWLTEEMPSEIHEHYKRNNMYKDGFAMVNGLIYRGFKKEKYIHAIDSDSKEATKLVCNFKGVDFTPEQLSEKGFLIQRNSES